jgi:hypothetical protein
MEAKRSNQTWLIGGLLIALGVVFLLNQLIPGLFTGLIWAAAFAIGGLVVYGWYLANKSQWWVLIPAYVMWCVASYILLGTTMSFLRGEVIGAWVMATIGFPFLYVYLRNRLQWWALIPAYTMGAIGLLILLSMILNGLQVAAYVMFAIAAPFFFVYLRNREHWWALIPGSIMAFIGMMFALAGAAYLIPALMIVAGIFLLVRQFAGDRRSKPVAVPATGPQADRPLAGFEPIGRKQTEAEEPERILE